MYLITHDLVTLHTINSSWVYLTNALFITANFTVSGTGTRGTGYYRAEKTNVSNFVFKRLVSLILGMFTKKQ